MTFNIHDISFVFLSLYIFDLYKISNLEISENKR